MTHAIADLPWLAPPPADFSARCKALGADGAPAGPELQRLAGFRLSPPQSASLGRALARLRRAGTDLAPLSGFRLGVIAATTVDLLAECLPAAAARHGVALELVSAPYDQVMQQALDPASPVNAARLDAVLVAVDHRWMQLDRPELADPAARVEEAIGRLRMVVEALREHGGAPAVVPTLAVPPAPLFGSYDRRAAGSVRGLIEAANRRIAELCAETGAYLLDVAALAERVGTDRWFDPVQWAAYKLAFSATCNSAYADLLGRLLGAIRGKARKCLVLDLDNTCWGGVIGDDGLDGIKIGQGSPMGEAFLAVQQAALDLRDRGVVLAVCSKNDDATARGPFREHPDMLLREAHIAVFQANWTDKASNLEAIARTLNIGVDALVLLDDNPAERAQTRAALPQVAVPELPDDPSWYPWMLASAGYFEAVSFSGEDRIRAAAYASDAQRAEVKAQARDLGDYLASLEMVMTVAPFDARGRQRIAQLINKTNQFNLTTRRYTEAEVAAFETDPSAFTLQVRLEDRFGDLGMIAVVVARAAGPQAWEIDSWLMSCRVLGRKVEEAMFSRVVEAARAAGIERLHARYLPTAKNGMVADHFDRLGFTRVEERADGARLYVFETAAYQAPALPMRIVDATAPAADAA